jgi:predicted nucleotidyltransferase
MSRPLSKAQRARLIAVVESDPRIVAAYLFGSRVRGDARRGSDLDVAVLFSEPVELRTRVELEDRLAAAAGIAVDCTDLGAAGAFLALDAVAGERVYCRDMDRCDEFELYVLRRAGDLAPFERERRRIVLAPDRRPSPRRPA